MIVAMASVLGAWCGFISLFAVALTRAAAAGESGGLTGAPHRASGDVAATRPAGITTERRRAVKA
jgi:hypothetical protein